MLVLAHGRTPLSLGFALLMQEHFKDSEIDGHGPASSYAEGVHQNQMIEIPSWQ